jgi:hypothetical protein
MTGLMILSYLKLMNGGKKLHYHTLSQLMNEVEDLKSENYA